MDFRSVCEVYVCCGLRVIACCPFLAHRTQQGSRVHRSECLFLCPHSKHTSPPALPTYAHSHPCSRTKETHSVRQIKENWSLKPCAQQRNQWTLAQSFWNSYSTNTYFYFSLSKRELERVLARVYVSFKSRSIHQRLFWTYLLIKFDQCLSSALHDDAFNKKTPLSSATQLIEDSEERWSVVIFWSVQGWETFFSNGHKLGN